MKWSLLALIFGFCIDLLLGDPQGFPHPVVLIGRLISSLERLLRTWFPKTPAGERTAGGILWLLVAAASTARPTGTAKEGFESLLIMGISAASGTKISVIVPHNYLLYAMQVFWSMAHRQAATSGYTV